MTPEGKVKRVVINALRARNIYYFLPATGGYGRSGVPDIVCCYNGRFVAVECKAGTNTPTLLQESEIGKIRAAKGQVFVVNERTLTTFIAWLDANAAST